MPCHIGRCRASHRCEPNDCADVRGRHERVRGRSGGYRPRRGALAPRSAGDAGRPRRLVRARRHDARRPRSAGVAEPDLEPHHHARRRRDGLAAGLAIEPTVALRVLPGSDPATVTVAPAQALEPGTRYRFRLTGPDGALAGAWAFQVKGPLHVVTTLPGDRSSGVPVSTGIELTFDQDGVVDAAAHFSIDPGVEGRFETHGRTLVFVPSKLEPATLYTVTLRAGVGVTGSDVRLEQDVRLRFETGTAPASTKEPDVRFGRAVIEASPAEKPVIVIAVYSPEEGTPTTRIPVEVYRLPEGDAALAATRTIADAPDWAQESSTGLVSTDGLRRVMAFEATVQPIDWG